MTYEVLYRKYRPKNLDEVRGQEEVVQALKSALKKGEIAHAYLFSGSRGLGKTSVARIFAREIKASDDDVYEIDAASNRGIDDIRALREEVRTIPLSSPYKVYIVDEVHMLTKEAFNALLKTLEEPPSHAIFILATTELNRLPETVISRCQVFNFKKPSLDILSQMIEETAKKEGFSLSKESARNIAISGEGSFRDTHGVLERILSISTDKKVKDEHIETIIGFPKKEFVNKIVEVVHKKEVSKTLALIAESEKQSIDLLFLREALLSKFRLVLLLRYAPEMRESLLENLSPDEARTYEAMAKEKVSGINSKTVHAFIKTGTLIDKISSPVFALELAILEALE